jgi:ssDNA-binding Zn-finger/Zn-ribbon topoisomerase 1
MLKDGKKCDGCGTSLVGGEISEKYLHYYNHAPNGELIHSNERYAEARDQIEDETTHYCRVIAVEYASGFDGVSEYRCPDCGRREGRWSGKVLQAGEFERRPRGGA